MTPDQQYGDVGSPLTKESSIDWISQLLSKSLAESPFNLGSMCPDLLEGVLQRVGPFTKKEAEQVNSRFATVARRRAWRHRRDLKVDKNRVNMFYVAPPKKAVLARFFISRCPIRRVEFEYNASHFEYGPPDEHDYGEALKRTQNRQILSALLAAERRVELRALLLQRSPEQLMGGSGLVVKLIERHSTSLQEAGLFFSHDADETALCDALCACANLSKLTVFLTGRVCLPSNVELMAERLQLQLTSLTLRLESCFCRCDDGVKLASLLRLLPRLTDLRLCKGLFTEFKADADWPSLASVRLLEIDFHLLKSTAQHGQAHMNWLFSRVLPHLQSLILSYTYSSHEYWMLLNKLIGAFLNRPGGGSLAVELKAKYKDDRWGELRTNFPGLIIRSFTAAVQGGSPLVEARPSLPPEFSHAAESDVFVLRRPNESRCITFAAWK